MAMLRLLAAVLSLGAGRALPAAIKCDSEPGMPCIPLWPGVAPNEPSKPFPAETRTPNDGGHPVGVNLLPPPAARNNTRLRSSCRNNCYTLRSRGRRRLWPRARPKVRLRELRERAVHDSLPREGGLRGTYLAAHQLAAHWFCFCCRRLSLACVRGRQKRRTRGPSTRAYWLRWRRRRS